MPALKLGEHVLCELCLHEPLFVDHPCRFHTSFRQSVGRLLSAFFMMPSVALLPLAGVKCILPTTILFAVHVMQSLQVLSSAVRVLRAFSNHISKAHFCCLFFFLLRVSVLLNGVFWLVLCGLVVSSHFVRRELIPLFSCNSGLRLGSILDSMCSVLLGYLWRSRADIPSSSKYLFNVQSCIPHYLLCFSSALLVVLEIARFFLAVVCGIEFATPIAVEVWDLV